MEPRLALTYNSQAGNGLLGVGWNLEGLSAVGRCPRTLAQDGVRGAVNYDANDRFCLDGQRLIAISGTYGADGTEYRTERESFTKVISYGTAGSGPAWFKAWTKAGQIMEYGNTADSRIEAQGKSSVRLWALNKVSDTKTNYLTVTYIEDNANGDFRPDRIDYTGNAGASTAPNASVRFTYQSRTDITPMYHAGSVSKTLNRTTNIKTYNGQNVVADYRMAYDNAAAAGRSRMTTMTECDAAGNCFAPTSAQWIAHNAGAITVPAAHNYSGLNFGSNPSNYRLIGGDFNGDGKEDYLRAGPSDLHVFHGDGAGGFNYPGTFTYPNAWNFGSEGYWRLRSGDFNADGKMDLIWIGPTFLHVFMSSGNGSFTAPNAFNYPSGWNFGTDITNWRIVLGDFNGDGRTDFLRIGPTYLQGFLSNGDGTFATPSPYNFPGGWNIGSDTGNWRTHPGDFDGDGKADIAVIGPTYLHLLVSNGDGQFTMANQFQYPGGWNFGSNLNTWQVLSGDYNGDGKMDFVRVGPTNAHTFSSKGDGTFSTVTHNYPSGWDFGSNPNVYQPATGDFNGDGKSDYARLGPTAGTIWLSNGDGTYAHVTHNYPGLNFGSDPNYWQLVTGDFTGDGRADYARLGPTYGHAFLASGTSSTPPDFASTMISGSGNEISIVYGTLANGVAYTKDAGAQYPTMDLQVSMHAVASTSHMNGVGGQIATVFHYGGLKAEVGTGRGMLGFRWHEAQDVQTGIRSRTEYRQDWPYVGLPSQTKTMQAAGAVLSQTDSSYGCMNPAGGGACTVVAGNRYFPYLSQSVQSGNDLNGAALPTVTTTQSGMDLYGNVGTVIVSTGDGYTKTTTNTYANDAVNWFLGRLSRSTVQSVMP